jgi:hypothetical protein
MILGRVPALEQPYDRPTQKPDPQRKGRPFTKNRKIKNDRAIVSLVARR